MAYGRPKEEYHFWSEDTDKDTDMTSDENEWNSAQVMKQESAHRQLDSTRRALASLNESEQIGMATAEVSSSCHCVTCVTLSVCVTVSVTDTDVTLAL